MLPPILPPRLLHILPEAQIRNNAMDIAQLAPLNHLPDANTQGKKPRPNRLHQKALLLPGRLDQPLRLPRIDREGLLAQDVFAREEAEHGVLVVVGVGRGDVDDVDVWVPDEVLVGAVGGRGGGAFARFEELLGAGGGG